MHIHILGVCGTFMGSLAQLAKAMGYKVTGSDKNVYPPMSTQLESVGIEIVEGFDPAQLTPQPDLVVVGNVVSRGNPAMEAVLNRAIPYISGPQWLAENLLSKRWVLAVSGTHGKTTTSTMLAWILEFAGYKPGYLIGGVPGNFPQSARLGESDFFVIEADEYDTAFFDKRSKFVHYHPNTLVINNIEFDHADIFDDLAAIQTQFHHLIRTVPGNGLVISPETDSNVAQVIQRGCWSEHQSLNKQWQVEKHDAAGRRFNVVFDNNIVGEVVWSQTGTHNVNNALAAIAAARHVGVEPHTACQALSQFEGVKRRMELLFDAEGVKVYDDFAHHPTAIHTTLQGLRAAVGREPIIAVIEPRSNTMKQGVHKQSLAASIVDATQVCWYQSGQAEWDMAEYLNGVFDKVPSEVLNDLSAMIDHLSTLVAQYQKNNQTVHIVIMSNGGFEGIHQKLINRLKPLLGGDR